MRADPVFSRSGHNRSQAGSHNFRGSFRAATGVALGMQGNSYVSQRMQSDRSQSGLLLPENLVALVG